MSLIRRAPVMFVSHGAPSFALEPGELGLRLRACGPSLDGLRALLVISPHWQTHDLRVSSAAQPTTIHDFAGFAPELYTLRYPAKGAPHLATEVIKTLVTDGWAVSAAPDQGMDHGVWVPLMFLRPAADLPIVQISLPALMTAQQAHRLGQSLQRLRARGIGILGSGSMTHNLSEFRGPVKTPETYVLAFSQWVQETIERRDEGALIDYRHRTPHAQRAHPTQKHFLPLLIAFGASAPEDHFAVLAREVRFGMLSMESYSWGLDQG